jgi:hypothetical protein
MGASSSVDINPGYKGVTNEKGEKHGEGTELK